MSPEQTTRASKFLSLVLRHQPETAHITLDSAGWTGVDELLRACYENSLKLAAKNGLKSIAFPCISTGVYRFPPDQAAQIAVQTVREFLAVPSCLERVIFCCFGRDDFERYQTLLA